jgi:hypothetical protein
MMCGRLRRLTLPSEESSKGFEYISLSTSDLCFRNVALRTREERYRE